MRDDRSSLASVAIESNTATNWWRMLFALSPGMLHSIDQNGRFVDVNQAWLDATGYARDEVIGQSALFVMTDESARYAFEQVLPTFWETGFVRDIHYRYRRRDGSLIDVVVDCNSVIHPETGRSVSLSYVRDVTALMKSERALRESETRYALAVQGANDGIWDWTIDEQRIHFSPRFSAMLGYDDGEFGETPERWLEQIHEDDRTLFELALQKHFDGLAPSFECECRVRTRTGEFRWVRVRGVAVRDKQGRACRIAGSQADIHDERIAIEQMRHYSLHDRLTGLPNRALFVDHLNMALSRWRREPRSMFAVVLLDLDRFKTINDSLGHDLGDELLVEAADRLRGAVREIDTIARLGGDEFALLLESLESHEQALATIDRINASLAQPFVLGGRTVYSSCSVGICLSSRGYVRGDELMRDADIALYRAKATKASVVLFARPMHEHAIARLEIETEMRLAMDERSFALAYQPIVDVSSERIVGFEVLARWNHATLGAISPSKFIPIAEETGLIHELGEWVLRRACEQRVYWASQGVDPELYVSVNISSRQLLGSRFVETVQGVLDQSGVDPQSVRLELTESALIESSTRALHVLTQLRALGLCLCLDDFGTGYSSLSYLHRYPIDVLKIDRSFVSQLETAGNSVLVDTILSLGRHLEKTVVAEGVETKAQLASLRELACGFAQGFYFSHPLDADAADRALALALPPARMSARK